MCIPGLPGFRCSHDIDCLVGDCVPTGEGFSLCALPCANDEDCARVGYNARDSFSCTIAAPDGRRYCSRPLAFDGSFCSGDDECEPGAVCSAPSPLDVRQCRRRCGAGDRCAAVGGYAQACATFASPPVCMPGLNNAVCSADDDCIAPRRCRPLPPLAEPEPWESGSLCAFTCEKDLDCDTTAPEDIGYCHRGVCSRRRLAGKPCDRNEQCQSRRCEESLKAQDLGSGIHRCVGP